MGYIPIILISSAFSALLFVLFVIYEEKDHIAISSMILAILFLLYSTSAIIAIQTKTTPEEEYAKYQKAKSEYEILKSDHILSVEAMIAFKEDVDNMNDLIRDSQKYQDHWYLGPFYYKSTADLPILNYDTIITNIRM